MSKLNQMILVLFTGLIQLNAQGYLFNKISSTDGLSESTNAYITHDSKGYVWISSIDGLNLYDGKTIKVFRPNLNDPYALFGENIQSHMYEDDQADLWFTTTDAINVYRRNESRFEHYFSKTPLLEEYMGICMESQRFFWVKAGDGLYRFDTKNPIHYSPSLASMNFEQGFAHNKHGNGKIKTIIGPYWTRSGIKQLEFDQAGNKIVDTVIKLYNRELAQDTLLGSHIVFLDDSSVYLTGYTINVNSRSGLIKYNPQLKKIVNFINYHDENILGLAQMDSENILITTAQTVLLNFNVRTSVFEKKQFKGDININSLTWMNFDKASSTLWMCFQNSGLYFANKTSEKFNNSYPFKKGIAHITLLPDSSILGFSKAGHALRFFPSSLIQYTQFEPNTRAKTLPNGKIIQMHHNKINVYDFFLPHMKVSIPFGSDRLMDFNHLTVRDIIFGSNDGLWILKLPQAKLSTLISSVPLSRVYKIYIDAENRIWAGDGNGNLYIFNLIHDSLKLLKHKKGIVNTLDILEDHTKPVIWVATPRGLLMINKFSLEDTLLSSEHGLPNQYIQSLVQDKNGILWMGTNEGILKFNPVSKELKRFTEQDGLSSSEYFSSARYLLPDGRLCFGGIQGMDIFHPDSLVEIGSAPVLHFNGLYIHDKLKYNGHALEANSKIHLNYLDNNIRIEMAALEFFRPFDNEFKVQMEKIDADWINLGKQNQITYANLAPGEYTFKFTACNAEKIWNRKPLEIELIIHPPFWQTGYFKSISILVFLGAAFGVFTYHFRNREKIQGLKSDMIITEEKSQRIEAESRQKEEMAKRQAVESELAALRAFLHPHFLFNALNSLNNYILNHDAQNANIFLGEFTRLMRLVFDYAQKKEVTLAEELILVQLYLEIEKKRFAPKIDYKISVHNALVPDLIIIPSMIIQLYAENAILHGLQHRSEFGGLVEIHIDYFDDFIVCCIQDNGIGRKRAEEIKVEKPQMHKSGGSRIMEERIKKLSHVHQVNITDLQNPTGTRVEVWIKRKQDI